jgi:hypothetical protein
MKAEVKIVVDHKKPVITITYINNAIRFIKGASFADRVHLAQFIKKYKIPCVAKYSGFEVNRSYLYRFYEEFKT